MRKIVSTIAVTLLMSLSSNFALAADNHPDPCEQLNGTWKGIWNNTYSSCRWDAVMEVRTYKDDVQIVAKLSNGSKNCDTDASVTISGICKDGYLELTLHHLAAMERTRMTGRVFGKVLTMEDEKNYRNVHAYKYS